MIEHGISKSRDPRPPTGLQNRMGTFLLPACQQDEVGALPGLKPGLTAQHIEAVRTVDAEIQAVAPEFLSPTWYAPGKVSVPAAIAPVDVDDGVLVTVIDPGAAFGLGDHPTTSATMALLASRLERPGAPEVRRLLDVGCGTGAVAVLAAQLGVPTIRAIDIADAAVEATQRNMVLNDVAGRIHVDGVGVGGER